MSIYNLMKIDWRTYCLMCSIMYIEEMSKPLEHIQIKKHKNKTYHCLCFRSIRLKMKDEEFVNYIFKITKLWEKKKQIPFIGNSFKSVRKENYSNQDMFLFTPLWLNYILAECGKIPNKYSFETAVKRIQNLKQYTPVYINQNKSLFNLLLKDKKLAAGAFILSMDLECRGVQCSRPSLCMSEKFKDFLKFMLKVAQKWKWTHNSNLSKVDVSYSKKLGINASPQHEFSIHMNGLKEIYKLAGPLTNSKKNKCVKFTVLRSKKYVNKGGANKYNNTREKLLKVLKRLKQSTSTDLQFYVNVRTDVVLEHLHKLEKQGFIIKKRKGKRYVWRILE